MLHLKKVLVLFVLCGSILSPALSQPASQRLKTFLVYYGGVPRNPLDARGYSVLVTEPTWIQQAKQIGQMDSNVIHLNYVNIFDIDTGAGLRIEPWSKDIMANHKEFLLATIGGGKNPSLPARQKYAWGYHQAYDSTTHNKDRFVVNPASKGWAEYCATIAESTLAKDDRLCLNGIFSDNVKSEVTWIYSHSAKELQIDLDGDGIMNRSDDRAWTDALIEFSRTIRSRLGPGVPLIANMGSWWAGQTLGLRLLAQSAFSGAMNECFLHFSLGEDSSSYMSLRDWQFNVYTVIFADSIGKTFLVQSLGRENDTEARLFCLGSFLLGAGSKSYYNYRYHESYDTLYHFPEFDLSVGSPVQTYRNVNEAYDPASSLYRRSFDSLDVFVNPSSHPVKYRSERSRKSLRLVGGITEKGGRLEWEMGREFDVPARTALILSRNP